jgi:predicted RNA methylase
MLILLLKSQLGLFDKIVPVAASVSKDGTVRAPHMAIRHVRAPQPKAAKPHHAENAELFAAPRAEKPKVAPKPKAETLDLFAERPKSDTSPEPVKKPAEIEHVAPRAAAPPAAPDEFALTAPEPSAKAGGTVNYDKPFDPSSVPAFGVVAGTSKDRRREINARVAEMVAGDLLGRAAPDLALMRQYSGNGGCGDSLNEFYTDPKVAAAMWKVLHDLGVSEGATALEPSCATGVFLETAPAGVKVTGVEMDTVSSRVGMVLHPQHEVQNASLERFATQDARQFDVVIGNAPFGLRGSLLKDDKKDLSTAEGYFLDTSLDKAKSGGLVAMIVPTGVMDSKRDRKLRERLLRKGEFLGALRMPNTAFEHSHTGVTTDVVFFRKRQQDVAGALGAVNQATLKTLGVWDDEFLAGSYYTERGAPNVLGTMTEGWRAKAGMGDDITVEGSMVGVPEAIAAFTPEKPDPSPTVEAILAACPDEEMRERARAGAAKNPYDQSKRGDTKMVDGIEYILEGEPLRWHRVDEFMQDKAVTDAQGLAVEIERAMTDDGYADASGLADKIKAYIEAHGIPAKNTNLQIAAATDKSLYRLIGAVKPDGTLSDVVTGRKAAPVESSFDAAAQSLALENGTFTPEQVAGRWHGGSADAVLDHLYASPEYALEPGSGLWTSTDQYLSGEMWPKLDEARAALAGEDGKPEDRAKFERQAALLEETIDPKSLEDVEVALNSAFLPLNVVAAFFNREDKAFEGQYAPKRMSLTFDKGIYAVNGGPWGSDLLGKYLNRTGVRKDDDLPVIEKWNREFKEWLCASPYRDEIEDLYNRKFRGFRQREYSDAPFDIPGLNPEGIKPHIYSGVRRMLESGKGIVADDVGLGKTIAGLILARMARVTGQAKKPMIVVPKSVLANWVAEAERWFPGCSVLTIGETYSRDKDGKLKGKQDSAAERNRKYHDLTQNDYDFVLISQPAWNDLDLDPITKGKYVEEDFWVQRGDSLGNAGDKRTNKIREAYDQAMAKREFATRTDAIYFNDLGVDMILADEAHAYKNLYAAKNRFGQSPKFLGGSGLSNRALDMALKTRWIRDGNDGKNVYGLTATPTKNSPLEIYSMLTHIAPEAFENIGIRNSEEFLDRFCEFRNENILNTRGEIEEALVTVGFKNLDELREIMRRFINRRTAEDVGLKLPARDDRQHLVDMSAEQQSVYAVLRELAAAAKGKDATGDAHIFSIMDKMSKAAMDLELYDPGTYAGAHSPKYAAAAEHIIEGAKDGGQVVFADNLAVHGKIVEALVAGGIPRDQIAIINAQEAESSAKRQNIADAFNAGKLKVVIGNTATMGEGINLQKGTTDVHHLDLPWEPASMQQRNGRGLRQGNLSESVRLHTYLAKGSFDGYRYQTMMAKKDWMDLLWNGGNRVDNLAREGALSRDDLMVMLAADPDKAREDMTKNKAAAEERFKAMKNTDAAENFVRFQDMKRSYGAMKDKDRVKSAGERLKVKLDRLRVALEENPHFTAKHALDAKAPVLVQPQTGHAYEDGVAFEVPTEGGAIHGGGKFVVTKVLPQVSTVQVRRYGSAMAAPMLVELKDMHHAAPFAYDAKAEQADIATHMAAAAKDKLNDLKGLKDLHGLPSAVIEGAYDTIQRAAKDGAKAYKFDLGYGDVGMISPEGKPVAFSSYQSREKLTDHDLMLPTDAHRKLVTDAYVADERAKKFTREAVTGRRGAHTGQYKTVLSYPGGYGQRHNRWGSVGDSVFGQGFKKDAHAQFEREQLESARHAKTLQEAVGHAALTATGEYGTMAAWPKRALAILWAKAKRDGKLDAPMKEVAQGLPSDLFNMSGGGIHKDGASMTVRNALMELAKHRNFNDLSAAMAVAGGDHEAAVKHVLGLKDAAAMGPALRHLTAKHPALADRRAREFANIEAPRRAYDVHGNGATPAHPLHAKFGDAVHSMTLADVADGLDAGDGDRDAA